MAKTLYQLLNIPESASEQQVHHAFKAFERLYTKRGDSASIDLLNRAREAFLILSDAKRRLAYDRKLAASRLPPTQPSQTGPIFSSSANRWRQPAMIAAVLLLLVTIGIYRSHEESQRQAEADRLVNDQLISATNALKDQQAQLMRQNQTAMARQQAELDAKRIEVEQRLRQQQLDDAKMLTEQQLQNQGRALDLMEKHLNTDARDQEQSIAERQLELQYKKPELEMALQEQNDQRMALQRQRTLRQHDENIASIHSLRAARLKAYDRDHESRGISTSNPAIDP